MASFGTPTEGVDNLLINAYTGLELRLYTNAFDSLDRDSTFSDFTEPSDVDSFTDPNGYAEITLSGTWSSSDGVISYDHGGGTNPVFENTGNSEDWNTVRGAFICDSGGNYVLHFKDFGNAYGLAVGEQLEVDISNVVT